LSKSETNFFLPHFSHLYIEKEARRYELAQKVVDRLPGATVVEIERYTDVFARPRQRFSEQKRSRKLILAVKRPPFVYRGADVCHRFGHEHFYYASTVLNCVYDCEYCFLQGMFPSANLVVFVNLDDFFAEVDALLTRHPLFLSVSYESDLLALERLVPTASHWIAFAAERPGLTLEIRTKSANYAAIRRLPPVRNVVLAWTLSPDPIAGRYEAFAPGLEARLENARRAAEDGWPVRLCFDPVLHVENWRDLYAELVDRTFTSIPADRVLDVSIGTFRVPKDYLRVMRKARPDSALLHEPYECRDGVCGLPAEAERRLREFVAERVAAYLPREKIFV